MRAAAQSPPVLISMETSVRNNSQTRTVTAADRHGFGTHTHNQNAGNSGTDMQTEAEENANKRTEILPVQKGGVFQ